MMDDPRRRDKARGARMRGKRPSALHLQWQNHHLPFSPPGYFTRRGRIYAPRLQGQPPVVVRCGFGIAVSGRSIFWRFDCRGGSGTARLWASNGAGCVHGSPIMRSDAPPFRNGRFPNRPYEGRTTTLVVGEAPRGASHTYMRPACRVVDDAARTTTGGCPSPPARLLAFAAVRKEAQKVTFELKRARLAIKRASFSGDSKRIEFKYIRANSKRIQDVFKRNKALLRTHKPLIYNKKRRIGAGFPLNKTRSDGLPFRPDLPPHLPDRLPSKTGGSRTAPTGLGGVPSRSVSSAGVVSASAPNPGSRPSLPAPIAPSSAPIGRGFPLGTREAR